MLVLVSNTSIRQPGLRESLVWSRVQLSVGLCGGRLLGIIITMYTAQTGEGFSLEAYVSSTS